MDMKAKYPTLAFAILILVAAALPIPVSAMSITVGIPGKYAEVKAGESVYFETEVKWPENTSRKDLQIAYSVKDKDGKEVAYMKVLKAIETQASFMDSITIPESTVPGLYKITATITDYKDLNQDVMASFNVISSGGAIPTYIFIVIGALSTLIIFLIIRISIMTRERPGVFERRIRIKNTEYKN